MSKPRELTTEETKARAYFAEAFFRTCPALQEIDKRLQVAQTEEERAFCYGMALAHGINQSDLVAYQVSQLSEAYDADQRSKAFMHAELKSKAEVMGIVRDLLPNILAQIGIKIESEPSPVVPDA